MVRSRVGLAVLVSSIAGCSLQVPRGSMAPGEGENRLISPAITLVGSEPHAMAVCRFDSDSLALPTDLRDCDPADVVNPASVFTMTTPTNITRALTPPTAT